MDYFVVRKDSNVIFMVHISYIEYGICSCQTCPLFVQKTSMQLPRYFSMASHMSL